MGWTDGRTAPLNNTAPLEGGPYKNIFLFCVLMPVPHRVEALYVDGRRLSV